MVPGRRPLAALRRALSQRDDTGLVLFIDQLEELLTVSEPEEARGAQALLARLVAGGGQDAPGEPRLDSVRVLAAVRGDYLTRLAEMPELGGLLEKHIYFVRALDPAGIRAAIVQPARRTGVAFESDELVEELQHATMRARGGTPLLQFALAELWAARDVARGVITRQSLDEIGGVAGALARYADAVLAELPRREQQAAAQRILTRLVTVHHRTRIRCTRRDLVGEDAAGQDVLERLVDRRLVVCHLAEGEWVYSIAHEALLMAWPTLRGWLDRESELLTLRGHLADGAQQWQALERSDEALWGQRLVRAAARIDVDELSSNEAAFLAASRRALWRARWLVRGIVLAVLVLGAGIYAGSRYQARRELCDKVNAHLAESRQALTDASTLRKQYSDARRHMDARLQAGEDDWTAAWEAALALDPQITDAYQKAHQAAEAAYALDPGREDVRALLAQGLEERAWFADATGRREDREDLVERLAVIDAKRAEPWQALIPVAVTTTPGGGTVEIRQYTWQPAAPFQNELIDMAEAPFEVELAPGSYLAIVQASEDHAEVRYPLEIRPRREPNARHEISIHRPLIANIPDGFVYVSEGWFWSGYGQTPEEDGYRDWHEASPLHLVHSDAYLIGEHETTYREWLEYVDDCTWRPCPGGAPARAIVAQNEDFLLEVVHEPGQGWQIHWKPDPAQDGYRAMAGDDLVYEAREHLRSQDWLAFPVSGVSWFEVQRYLAWLREVRGIHGADLCTEAQWERAARGADARLYPHGNGIAGGDANIDKSYGQVQGAFGPDAVDAHPQNESPFGLLDMAGNVAEMTRPAQGETAGGASDMQPVVVRGGAFYITAIDARVFSRWDIMPDQSSALVGFRVCAAAPRE
jgi:formylglycine-generating enzyme required for sulfatase activity